MSVFLTTNSDGAVATLGIGAVCEWHLILFCLAKHLNVGVSISPYKNIIGYEYSGYSNGEWNKSFTDFFNFPYETNFDKQLEFNGSYEDLQNFIESEKQSNEKTLVHLSCAVVRSMGEPRLHEFYERGYLNEVRDNLVIDKSQFSSSDINVSFHIRTINPGDVPSEIANPSREYCGVRDNFYRYNNIISFIGNKHPNEKIRLHIHSQGNPKEYEDFVNLTSENLEVLLHLNVHPIIDIYQMSVSDYLIMSNSSYSWICHLLNFNTTFVRDNFWHPTYPTALKIDYNYNPV